MDSTFRITNGDKRFHVHIRLIGIIIRIVTARVVIIILIINIRLVTGFLLL
jgi:hypothetical protein